MIKNLKKTVKVVKKMRKDFKRNTKDIKTDEEVRLENEKNKLVKYYEEIS